MHICILYFSGAGATQAVAELMTRSMGRHVQVERTPVEQAGGLNLGRFDALVVGTPVYHAAPAALLMEYIAGISPLAHPLPAFLYNTRAMFSCTNRILAKALQEKNILTVQDRDYRSPASDGSLIAPFVGRFFEFERSIGKNVSRDCDSFVRLLQTGRPRAYIPRLRVSGVVNGPNKLAGTLVTFPIHLHKDRCIRCGLCIRDCPHQAWKAGAEGYPIFRSKRCENCYRCIHHCPGMALSLRKRRPPGKQLQGKYAAMKDNGEE